MISEPVSCHRNVSYQRRVISSNERPAFPPHSTPDNGSDQPPLVSVHALQFLAALLARQFAQDDHAENLVLGYVGCVAGADQLTVLHDADPVGKVENVVQV